MSESNSLLPHPCSILVWVKASLPWCSAIKKEKKHHTNVKVWKYLVYIIWDFKKTYIETVLNKVWALYRWLFTPFWGDKIMQPGYSQVVDSVRILGAHSLYSSCLLWWGARWANRGEYITLTQWMSQMPFPTAECHRDCWVDC